MANVTELKEISEELSEIEIQISSLLERQQYLLERKHELENHLKDTSKPSTSSTNVAQKRQNFAGANFAWSKEIEQARKDVFNIDSFRPLQLECMNATMSGCDCILIMPTGGGKSLCFQLPAVVSKGFNLVVSPLVSLMEDQLIALHRLGIKSEMLNASCSREKVNSVHAAMVDKKSGLKLLYVTPEKIAKSKRFMAKLEKGYEAGLLSRIVIDEVHCASQWGHDFRPDYKILGILKRQYPGVPILGLTATATSKVIEDVKKILGLQSDCLLLKASFNRPNLFYEVRHKPPVTKDCLNDIHQLITTRFNKQSGIIYCFSRQDSEDLARELMTRGVKAACYHADMPSEARSQVHLNWTQNKIQVVVATIAFGMGIDKPDVRFVIHHSLSKSMENYYQESGRAGRDDKRSHCILYYRPFDAFRQLTMVFTEQTGIQNLYNILRYCQDETQCRRSLIGQYFGEAWDPQQCKGMCDHCLKSDDKPQPELTDITDYTINIIKILDQASSLGERVTPNKLLDAWKGKGQTSLRVRSVTPPKLSQDSCERLIVHLLFKGILKEEFHYTPYSTICYVVKGTRGDMVLRGLKVKMDIRDGDDDASKSKSACAPKRKNSSSTSKKETKSHNGLPATDSTSKKRKKDVNTQEVEFQTVDGGDKKSFVVLSDSDNDEDFVL